MIEHTWCAPRIGKFLITGGIRVACQQFIACKNSSHCSAHITNPSLFNFLSVECSKNPRPFRSLITTLILHNVSKYMEHLQKVAMLITRKRRCYKQRSGTGYYIRIAWMGYAGTECPEETVSQDPAIRSDHPILGSGDEFILCLDHQTLTWDCTFHPTNFRQRVPTRQYCWGSALSDVDIEISTTSNEREQTEGRTKIPTPTPFY